MCACCILTECCVAGTPLSCLRLEHRASSRSTCGVSISITLYVPFLLNFGCVVTWVGRCAVSAAP